MQSDAPLPDLAVEFLHLELELRLQVGDLLLVLEDLLPQLVSLIHQQPMLLPEYLVVTGFIPLRKILVDLVGEMLVEILGHLQFLLYYFQLIL